ncbi:hypothetical protein [Paracoccus benzoatiresistens]|uniref:RES domain-containing protein n=1 Tax=Paracoccus benzoatiresistens TaxID=2997341 RepID=A0ABT4J6H7_9RHOB|nr:hypothetical protein [Paracoccus sp. EF6]MCZ0962730.1 hypothetical protein [Paracoccus sp. EF6]
MSPARHDTPRGWVEVRAIAARTGLGFAVYDLTETRDRARLVYLADSRQDALQWALRWAALTGRRLDCPEVFHAASGRLRDALGVQRGR